MSDYRNKARKKETKKKTHGDPDDAAPSGQIIARALVAAPGLGSSNLWTLRHRSLSQGTTSHDGERFRLSETTHEILEKARRTRLWYFDRHMQEITERCRPFRFNVVLRGFRLS